MTDELEFKHVTTQAVIESYKASVPIFISLLKEVRLLSKKKPEATMSAGKVKIINQVLADLYAFLKDEPTGKYLNLLGDKTLPQMSDAVLAMVQFDTAVDAFRSRYNKQVGNKYYWITEELLKAWEEQSAAEDDDDDEGDGDEDDESDDDDGIESDEDEDD